MVSCGRIEGVRHKVKHTMPLAFEPVAHDNETKLPCALYFRERRFYAAGNRVLISKSAIALSGLVATWTPIS